jgi:hypothetical protein
MRMRASASSTVSSIRLILAVVVSLSSVQLSRAAILCLSESWGEREACQCERKCDPSLGMHGSPIMSFSPARSETHRSISYNRPEAPEPSRFSCCRELPPSDRPVAVSTLSPVVVHHTQRLIDPVTPDKLTFTKAFTPPHSSPLFLVQSRLLI